MMFVHFFFFFFFQAEDGIRDKLVTGVQTCALPIWWQCRDMLRTERISTLPPIALSPSEGERVGERSEERRVGKECRWRWGANHEKKKKKIEVAKSMVIKAELETIVVRRGSLSRGS